MVGSLLVDSCLGVILEWVNYDFIVNFKRWIGVGSLSGNFCLLDFYVCRGSCVFWKFFMLIFVFVCFRF